MASAQTRIKELQSKLTLQAKQLAGAEDERVKAVNAAVKKALDDAGEAAAEEVRTQLLAKEEQHVVAICSLKSEHAKEKNQQGGQQIVGYRQQEVCNIRKMMIEETIEEVTGYRTRIEVDNRIITVETQNPLAVNERVEISRKTTYTLR